MKTHEYHLSVTWTGNKGTATSAYGAYRRSHELSAQGKYAPILASSDPVFCGESERYNPEELLVAALSACHMLWMLHLCADAGIIVVEYSHEPSERWWNTKMARVNSHLWFYIRKLRCGVR